MTAQRRKRIALVVGAVVVLALVVYGFIPEAETVELTEARYGPLQVSVEEEGVTRVADRYVVSSPTAWPDRQVSGRPPASRHPSGRAIV